MRWVSRHAACAHVGRFALAMPDLPQTPNKARSAAGEVSVSVFYGLEYCTVVAQAESQVGDVVSAAVQPAAGSRSRNFDDARYYARLIL